MVTTNMSVLNLIWKTRKKIHDANCCCYVSDHHVFQERILAVLPPLIIRSLKDSFCVRDRVKPRKLKQRERDACSLHCHQMVSQSISQNEADVRLMHRRGGRQSLKRGLHIRMFDFTSAPYILPLL